MASVGKNSDVALAPHDLTNVLSKFLDLHLMFPLLEFLEAKGRYAESEVRRARLDLLEPTNMVDYAMEIHAEMYGQSVDDAPQVMKDRRNAVLDRMEDQEKEVSGLKTVLGDEVLVAELKANGTFTVDYLGANHGVKPESIEQLYNTAKFHYECGDYEGAREMLSNHLTLSNNQASATGLNALWGKFACEILLKQWDNALSEIANIQAAIEDCGYPPLELLQQRSWLLHWSLFVFFNHAKGRDGIVDLYFKEPYMQAIQTNCPWLLRYLTAAVIINKRKRAVLKDLVRVIQQEHYTYADPITEFLECLYVHFDFEGAQQKLRECEGVLQADYFLCNIHKIFMEDARMFIFEVYCRIHQKIDISMLANKLAMEPEEAEKWVVDLIRGTFETAKINSQENYVIMGNFVPTVYQQVIDKTKDLTERSLMLTNSFQRQTGD